MPKPLDEWLWKAMREWQMPGHAVNRHGVWHRGHPETFAPCGKWLAQGFVRAEAGKGEKLRSPWQHRPARAGELCKECFADEIGMAEAVWDARWGPPKGYTPPQEAEKEWVRY